MPTNNHPKPIDGLMRYMRDEKNIDISGSTQKRKLRNIGYYHGYKGYRYVNNPNNKLTFSSFNEITAIYDFDAKIKAILYPQVMFIETALKNYVLEILLKKSNSDSFNVIYSKLLNNCNSFSPVGKKYKNAHEREKAEEKYKTALKKRLDLRDRVYNVQTTAYGNKNKIAEHFIHKDINLPIWAIFELLSLGEFGHFVSCINYDTRKDISTSLGIRPSVDSNALLTQRLIYAVKDLRNSIAHNDVIFDTRFRSSNIDNQVISNLTNETGITNISFNTITDYMILVVYMLKMFETPKLDIRRLINEFDSAKESLRKLIPINIYNQIIHTDTVVKINSIKAYI